ncbi:hypothetical protein BpHYR1_016860 [Brachionus plicatilis]|uniref:Uncharacterized protein n=1 Tax=Brachionus plicatilis TaxID=10195 RepID=A0A3M7SU39_BRAPC|nr:hypothetical protein BpHYR1_016860 [Brachionus plicatilis]
MNKIGVVLKSQKKVQCVVLFLKQGLIVVFEIIIVSRSLNLETIFTLDHSYHKLKYDLKNKNFFNELKTPLEIDYLSRKLNQNQVKIQNINVVLQLIINRNISVPVHSGFRTHLIRKWYAAPVAWTKTNGLKFLHLNAKFFK